MINNIVSGHNKPNKAVITSLIAKFGVSEDWIESGIEPVFINESEGSLKLLSDNGIEQLTAKGNATINLPHPPSEILYLQELLRAKDEIIAQLRAQLSDKDERIKDKDERIKDKEALIKRQDDLLKSQEMLIDILKQVQSCHHHPTKTKA